MKNYIKSIATALLMIVSLSSFAYIINPLKDKSTKDIMVTYAEAITSGNHSYNKYLFSNDFEYVNTANNNNFNKKRYIKFLESTKGLKFNCKTNYQVLDESGKSCVAKVTMEFDNFTRVDLITLKNTEEGWQVSKVVATYP